ncbi:lipopolysaccharide biosynthesis protein [uncultured Porphyromonas sp.]|uniref:lipopolysaccharide biosynthesis protein n=1 Tax=uncultured Porphyromonas sp. TaxID=159274 RepID=UPI002805CA61|nr:lipopolysaccharide biosynthesis protein [uncultured Porphyromonas sp.]
MKVPRSLRSILADSGLLLSVGVGVQLIALLLLPWVSRLYTPDTLGDLALILSIATLLSIAVGGRYDQAIVVCQEPLERDHLLRLTLWITALVTLALFALTLAFEPWIGITRYATLQGKLWLIPPVVCTLGLCATLSNYALSLGQFKRIATSKAVQGLGNNGLKVGFGLFSPSVWSLWGAQIASTLLAIIPLLRPLKHSRQTNSPSSRRELGQVARKYRAFPLFSLPQAAITTLLGSILILMLPLGYTTVEIGLVTMATMLARRPVQLIADSVSQVYFNRLSVAHHAQAPWRPLVRPLLMLTLVAGIPTLLILWWAMPYLVRWLLAPEYAACTEIIRAMLVYLFVFFFTSIINVIPDIIGRQRAHLQIQLLNLFLQVALLVLLIYVLRAPFAETVSTYYLVIALYHLLYGGWLLYLLRRHDQQLQQSNG